MTVNSNFWAFTVIYLFLPMTKKCPIFTIDSAKKVYGIFLRGLMSINFSVHKRYFFNFALLKQITENAEVFLSYRAVFAADEEGFLKT